MREVLSYATATNVKRLFTMWGAIMAVTAAGCRVAGAEPAPPPPSSQAPAGPRALMSWQERLAETTRTAGTLDVTFAKHPGVSEWDAVSMGDGPAIGIGPNFHPGLVARLKEVAADHEVPYQIDPAPGRSGTDAWAIQVTHEGVPTALVSVPLRYMHQPVETLVAQDVERAGRLLTAFIAGLEMDFLEKLAWNHDEKARQGSRSASSFVGGSRSASSFIGGAQ